MLIGAAARLILGRSSGSIDWGMALVCRLVGCLVGGLVFSLVAGDSLELRPSGIIGSILGALIVTALWRWRARSSGAAA